MFSNKLKFAFGNCGISELIQLTPLVIVHSECYDIVCLQKKKLFNERQFPPVNIWYQIEKSNTDYENQEIPTRVEP